VKIFIKKSIISLNFYENVSKSYTGNNPHSLYMICASFSTILFWNLISSNWFEILTCSYLNIIKQYIYSNLMKDAQKYFFCLYNKFKIKNTPMAGFTIWTSSQFFFTTYFFLFSIFAKNGTQDCKHLFIFLQSQQTL